MSNRIGVYINKGTFKSVACAVTVTAGVWTSLRVVNCE